MSQAFVILFVSISIQGHCFQEVQSCILCQSAVMHAVSLLWSNKMIGRGWEEGIIQRVAPAGCNRRPPLSSLIYREAVGRGLFSPVQLHHCHLSQRCWQKKKSDWPTSCLNQKVIIGWCSRTHVRSDHIAFVVVPVISVIIGRGHAWPIRLIPCGPILCCCCFMLVRLDASLRW